MVARPGRSRSAEKAEIRPLNRRRKAQSGGQGAAGVPGGPLVTDSPPMGAGGFPGSAARYSRCTASPRPSDHSNALDCWVS